MKRVQEFLIDKQSGGGQFVLSGYDPRIDYLKGFSILCVLLTHCVPYEIQDALLFSLWGAQAVPIFLIIQCFHCYKKGLDSVHISFDRLWTRIVKPFLVATAIIYILYIGYGLMTHVGVPEQTIKFLKSGGTGPGSYYVWVYLQFFLLIPLMTCFVKRLGLWGNLLLFAIIAELLELLCSWIHLSEWLYRLLFFRYFFLIFIGYYLVKKQISLNVLLLLVTIICGAFIIFLQYYDVNWEPFVFKSDWKIQHWFTYGYDLFIIFLLTKLYGITEKSWTNKSIQLLGKYSYEIFLWQMLFFCLPIRPIFTRVFGESFGVVIYILFSLIICTIPVLYVKNKKELIQLWSTKK